MGSGASRSVHDKVMKGEGGSRTGKDSPGNFRRVQVSLGESGRVYKVLRMSERVWDGLGGSG